MSRKMFRRALLASVIGWGATPALAQDTAATGDQTAATDQATIVVIATVENARKVQLDSKASISILSREDLEHTAAHNVAEALGMMPSVNVMNTGSSFIGGVDGASRGEGRYVSIRGLNAAYNVNLINGAPVAQGEPFSRAVQLSLLPPTGLSTIILNKTSGARMDGDAIGGTVDFRTPTAYDFADGTHGSVTATGRLETRARQYGDSGLGGGLAGELATRFGAAREFGLYVSGYYDERHYANSELAGGMAAVNDGGWGYLVTDAKGNSYPGLNPEQNLTQTGVNVGVSNGNTRRWGGNASLDWKPDDTLHLYLRGTFAQAKTAQNSTLSQFSDAGKTYTLVPGTDRYSLGVKAISTRVWYETNPEDSMIATATFGGVKKAGNWTIAPELFFSQGHNNRPNHIEASARINQSDQFNHGTPRPLGGLSMGYTDNFPRPFFTPDTYADLDDATHRLLARRAGQLTEQFSNQTKYGGRLDLSRSFDDGALHLIEFGGKFVTSERHVTDRDWTNDHFANLLGHGGETWASLGLVNGAYAHVYPGEYGWSVPKVNQDKLYEYFYKYQNAASFDTCGSLAINNQNCNTQKGRETVFAAYADAQFETGDWEVTPGVRFEHTDIRNTYWLMPSNSGGEQPGFFEDNSTHYNALLPSLFVNYRPSRTFVARGDLWLSYVRPAFFQLAGGARQSVGDDGNVTITMGNPNLKPIRAINADLSSEWSYAPGGYMMAGGFYKHLSDYLFDSGSGRTNSSQSQGANNVFINTPTNGGDGNVYGLEVQVRQQFKELPGLLSGLGIGFNLTRQWTKVDIGGGVQKRIQNAPEIMGEAQIFYQHGPASIDLIYHYAGSYIESYNYLGQPGQWDDRWIRPISSVDLHVGYKFGPQLKADLSVTNLFNNYTYWAHVGQHSLAISDVVNSGTTALASIRFGF